MLSLLIPTYNHACYDLVAYLHAQCMREAGLAFEILVAEDGSDQPAAVRENARITLLPHCRHIINKENRGRSFIRNFLAREARGESLLYVDAQMLPLGDDYVARYRAWEGRDEVVYGGFHVATDNKKLLRESLRMRYERQFELRHPHSFRQAHPYLNFNTRGFMAPREVMLRLPFDESLTAYGYEDVLWGGKLEKEGVKIVHINAPLLFLRHETNEAFMQKTRLAINNLRLLRDEMRPFSSLLQLSERLPLRPLMASVLHALRPAMERNLRSKRPSVRVFQLWKLALLLAKSHGTY